MSLLGKKYGATPPPPDKDTWYRCPKCPYKTRQRKGLSEVMHNCPKTKSFVTLKEDT